MSAAAVGTAVAGGVQAAIEGIVMATDGDIATVLVPVIVRVIVPDKAMRINEICTATNVISLDLQRKVRRAILRSRRPDIPGPDTGNLKTLSCFH